MMVGIALDCARTHDHLPQAHIRISSRRHSSSDSSPTHHTSHHQTHHPSQQSSASCINRSSEINHQFVQREGSLWFVRTYLRTYIPMYLRTYRTYVRTYVSTFFGGGHLFKMLHPYTPKEAHAQKCAGQRRPIASQPNRSAAANRPPPTRRDHANASRLSATLPI